MKTPKPVKANSETEKNLLDAFAGESKARNKYMFYASLARDAGFEQIAAIFEETADNEKEHAKMIWKLLGNYNPDLVKNLKDAIEGEHYETNQMYPEFEKVARRENFSDAAIFFKEVGEVEEQHEKRYRRLLKSFQDKSVFKKDKEVVWKCRNCGYIHIGKEAPKECPNCLHPQSFFELQCENY